MGAVLLLTACSTLEPAPPPTPTIPAPTPTPAPAPPEAIAARYFDAWQQGQYDRMYDLLSGLARTATPRDLFVRRYSNIHAGIGESHLAVQASAPAQPSGDHVEVPFQVARTVALFGDISEPNALPLVQDGGEWRVDWRPSLIFTGLTTSSSVRVIPDVPKRGRILDRAGKPLADNGAILAIGVVPGEIKDEAALLEALSTALEIPPETIKQRYQGGQPTWFMPITTRSHDDRPDPDQIGSIPGVSLQDEPSRTYPLGQAAAHVVGYVGHPTADELRQLSAQGYDESDWVGRAGFEAFAETTLAGQRGGSIQVADQAGRVFRTIVQKAAVPGQDLTLAIDGAIQNEAANALADGRQRGRARPARQLGPGSGQRAELTNQSSSVYAMPSGSA
jgi:hypothetical protein